MASRACAVVLLLVVAAACSSPALAPTPTVSVHDVYTIDVARLVPQAVFNCMMDRETERISRLSAREISEQELAVQRGDYMERYGVVLHVQGLSCWAVHASDAEYVTFMGATGGAADVLPSWQLCIEDAMGQEGLVATSVYIGNEEGRSLYTDQALQCFPSQP